MQLKHLVSLIIMLYGLVVSASCQTMSYTYTYPAHIYRITSNANGNINGELSWQGSGAILNICLLKGGMALNSRDCFQTF